MSSLASLTADERQAVLDELTDAEVAALRWDWRTRARPKQLPPEGPWFVWLLLAGRGFGKTAAGVGWIHERAMAGDEGREMMMIGRTPSDVRDVMIEGPSGIMKMVAPWERPEYEPAKRLLTWPTGARALVRSGANPEELRGFSGDTAWCDEFAAWAYPTEAWNNLVMGMREPGVGEPRVCITTTPKPIAALKKLVERDWCEVVTGSSYENRENLSEVFYEAAIEPYEGSRLGRQEIYAELLDDVPGALWSRQVVESVRLDPVPSQKRLKRDMARIVVGVDPAGSTSATASETGIVVCGRDDTTEPCGYILEDRSGRYAPEEWAHEVRAAYRSWEADAVVGERNFGGDLVESNLRAADMALNVIQVHASRGKQRRAEPIAGLYGRQPPKVRHAGTFERLEDQMCTWDPTDKGQSPDRVDAMVWAMHELMLEGRGPAVEHAYAYEEAGGFVL